MTAQRLMIMKPSTAQAMNNNHLAIGEGRSRSFHTNKQKKIMDNNGQPARVVENEHTRMAT